MTTDVTSGATASALPPVHTWAVRIPRVVAWSVVPVYVAGVFVDAVLTRRLGSPGGDPLEGTLLEVGFGMFAAMGALLVGKRPGNAVGWVMAAAALFATAGGTGDTYAAWVMTTRGRPDPLAVLGAWLQSWYWLMLTFLIFAVLPMTFPDGRLPSRRWRVPAGLSAFGAVVLVVLGMLTGTLTGQDVDYRIDNPIGINGLAGVEDLPVFGPLTALVILGMGTGVAAVVVRFRRSRGAERQQMKWFLFGVTQLALLPLGDFLPPVVGNVLFAWVVLALPVVIAVAVLRYRLDDIDVVISRTLVYALLTMVVVGIYVLIVGYLGVALRRPDDLLVSLIATGIVAVLFAPLRDRLQRAVGRLLYGERAEPYTALSRLGERLESTLAPEAVLPAIVTTVRESLRVPYAAIALADGQPAAESGIPVPGTARFPLLYRSEQVGELVIGPRAGEDGFSSADRRLLGDLARQAGVAVSSVRLTADLQRSRERLVATREEERRRLRRDLHDGLGAQLAGLAVQTGVLRGLIPRDPEAADALAAELRAELRTAIADIRRLVHGLRPPALDELGLVGALQRLAEGIGADGSGPHISVDVPVGLPPLTAAVEVAAYRVAQEALTNVVRHADARTATVRLTVDPLALTVAVEDDGTGLPDDVVAGVGLSSMRERTAEMGGTCAVQRIPGGGTRVQVVLPRGEE